MQPIEQHPDEIKDWHDLKAIHHGSRQAADDAAMDAMWEALESGKSKEEADEIFSKTYQSIICASKETNAVNYPAKSSLKQL